MHKNDILAACESRAARLLGNLGLVGALLQDKVKAPNDGRDLRQVADLVRRLKKERGGGEKTKKEI